MDLHLRTTTLLLFGDAPCALYFGHGGFALRRLGGELPQPDARVDARVAGDARRPAAERLAAQHVGDPAVDELRAAVVRVLEVNCSAAAGS